MELWFAFLFRSSSEGVARTRTIQCHPTRRKLNYSRPGERWNDKNHTTVSHQIKGEGHALYVAPLKTAEDKHPSCPG